MTEDTKVVVKPDTSDYTKAKSAAGGQSLHNGDIVARALAGATLGQAYTLAADVMKVEVAELEDKYKNLNDGMQRMALGNRLRGWIAKTDKGDKEFGCLGTNLFEDAIMPLREAIDSREKAEAEAKATKIADAKAKKEAKAEAEKELEEELLEDEDEDEAA